MPDINKAYQWIINACNSPNIGYSQTYRRGKTVNGITYYDCSSLISAGLTVGGFFETNPWFTTRNMGSILKGLGFVEYPSSVAWLPGDIMWKNGHTEMCYTGGNAGEGGVTMGAHSADRPLADQVSIGGHTNYDYYSILYRWGETPVTELKWISNNSYLSEDEKRNNAYVFYSTMFFKGFTLNSIAGMLGNIESESTINPGIWQNLDEGNYNLGFGLVQWTPATNYTNWANSKGYEIGDGNGQCEWLDTESDKGQWIPTSNYNITWEEFKNSTGEPEYLASAFLKNFERAGVEVEEERRSQARKWFDYLKTLSPYPPDVHTKNKKMPIYFYLFP